MLLLPQQVKQWGERAHRSFLKFVIGTLFHKPAPETQERRLSQGNWREFGGKFVSAVWLLHVPHFPVPPLLLLLLLLLLAQPALSLRYSLLCLLF